MCIPYNEQAVEEAWGEITHTTVSVERRVLPFCPPGLDRRKRREPPQTAWAGELPIADDQLPSSLAPRTQAPARPTFRRPHLALEYFVMATALLVAVFTALTIPLAEDVDAERHMQAQRPVTVDTLSE
jgi:hypothetical protein